MFVEKHRGKLGSRERKQLISANLSRKHPALSKMMSEGGDLVILFSKTKEFIFGDGFYQNMRLTDIEQTAFPRVLVPLTPKVALLYFKPAHNYKKKRVFTRIADCKIIDIINLSVQVYSKNWLFFRNEQPKLSSHFIENENREFTNFDPVINLIGMIPCVNKNLSRYSGRISSD